MSLNARVVAIQGIGFSAIQLATQGLLDYIVGGGTTRRPKSTNTLKLQRIKDGRAMVLSAKALTHARSATGKGAVVPHAMPMMSGAVMCVPTRATSKVRALRAKGYAVMTVVGCMGRTRVSPTDSAGGATAACARNRNATSGNRPASVAAGRASLAAFTSFSAHGNAVGQGIRNLSDAEVAAVVRVTIDRRR
jgi:hypothetical protein